MVLALGETKVILKNLAAAIASGVFLCGFDIATQATDSGLLSVRMAGKIVMLLGVIWLAEVYNSKGKA